MNLMSFLSMVDSLAGSCTEEQLRHFVHESARTTPEENRYPFLLQLQAAAAGGTEAEKSVEAQPAGVRDAASHGEACAEMVELLEDIEKGTYTIETEINEEYDDWYNSEEDEFLYEDPNYIMDDLGKACNLVHLWVKEKDYGNALALGTRLTRLTISTSGESDEDLNLWSASGALDVDLDLRALMLDTMTAAYYASSQRCEDICSCATSPEHLTLEDLLQYTEEELPDFPTFLREWVSFLGKVENPSALIDGLYQEAIAMLPDSETRISFVRQFAERRPDGYRLLLEDAGIPDEQRWDLGLEALEKIRGEGKLRAEIAMQTAEIAVRTGKSQEELEACWLKAFASAPSAVHYLRAYLHARDPKATQEKLDAVVAVCQKRAAADAGLRYHWDSLSPVFQFLQGDAMNAFIKVVLNESWSWYSFSSGCSYLCLAALYPKVPETRIMRGVYGKAREALSFAKAPYLRGVPKSAIQDLENAQPQLHLQGREELDEDQLFLLCFRQWEAQAVSFSDAEAKEILDGLEKVVEKEMAGTATRHLAHHYGDFAQLLASVGEVRESLGQAGAKQQILSRFGYMYGRRPNFVAELRNCGWNGR